MKIVINNHYGVFSLPPTAIARYLELKGKKAYFFYYDDPGKNPLSAEDVKLSQFYVCTTPTPTLALTATEYNKLSPKKKAIYNEQRDKELFFALDIPRYDPHLIQVVEELKNQAADNFFNLAIVEIPDDIDYEIYSYDGKEIVVEKGHCWSSENQ